MSLELQIESDPRVEEGVLFRSLMQTLMEMINGTPSIVRRLKDKRQPARRDKRQSWRLDALVARPYDMTYDLEYRLGIR